MNVMINPGKSTEEEIKNWLINVHEKYYIELKKANELPTAFWDSYSAFSNTAGGWAILGVFEGHPYNEITGVGNVEKTITSLWDQLSNPNKVSYRTVQNEDVSVHEFDGKKVILIHVHEAPESMKPVYLGGKIDNTFIRTGDGDRRATKEDISAFLRNAQPGQDNLVAENFGMVDLDEDSILSFKEKIHKRFPKKKYLEMDNEQFLIEIGACVRDRSTGEFHIKRGTLLFLGKCNTIKELYPHYHVDYFNRRGNNPRWADRITDDEPSDYEMNLYNFFSIVNEKIKSLSQESFMLDGSQLRIPLSHFDETLRECLVNCIAHADYTQGYPTTKIEAYDGWFKFSNPGKMLVSPGQFVIGGDSRPRNEVIMKLFRLLGASERQGFGGPLIYKTAIANDWRNPEVFTDIERTELKIWNIDLVDSYPNLEVEEKSVLRFILKSHRLVSVKEIRTELNMTEYRTRKCLQVLEDNKIINKTGNGPSTKYSIAKESTEMYTQLQMAMDVLKKHLV